MRLETEPRDAYERLQAVGIFCYTDEADLRFPKFTKNPWEQEGWEKYVPYLIEKNWNQLLPGEQYMVVVMINHIIQNYELKTDA